MEEREAHLDAPPKNCVWPFLRLSFELPSDATWGTPLNTRKLGTIVKLQPKGTDKVVKAAEEDYYKPSGMTDVVEAQTIDTVLSTVSLLYRDLNKQIKKASVQPKADPEATKV